MRITVLGLPGSGKSTLALKIAVKLDIPHIHIDRFWLEGGGGHNSRTTPDPEKTRAHVKEEVDKAIQSKSWVSDGVYMLVQKEIADRADIVLFLDIPLWRRLLNHAERTIHRKRRHREMTFLADLAFFPEIVSRDLRKKTKIRNLVESYKSKAIILKSRKEISAYFKTLPS